MIFFILFFNKCNVRTKVTKHSAALNFKSQIKLGNGERNVLTVGSQVPYAYFAMYTMQPEAKNPRIRFEFTTMLYNLHLPIPPRKFKNSYVTIKHIRLSHITIILLMILYDLKCFKLLGSFATRPREIYGLNQL